MFSGGTAILALIGGHLKPRPKADVERQLYGRMGKKEVQAPPRNATSMEEASRTNGGGVAHECWLAFTLVEVFTLVFTEKAQAWH
jgi:hypothetical protein